MAPAQDRTSRLLLFHRVFDTQRLADEHLQFGLGTDKFLSQDIFLGKAGHKDFAIRGAITIVRNVEAAIGRLKTIRVGNALALINHQPALPGFAIILGKPSAQLNPAFMGVDAVAMLY